VKDSISIENFRTAKRRRSPVAYPHSGQSSLH
jgi:hypothetical protein